MVGSPGLFDEAVAALQAMQALPDGFGTAMALATMLGLLIAGGTGAVGLAVGGQVLETAFFEATVPLLGHVTLVTALFFDIGVYLAVVGLALMVFESFGDDPSVEARPRRSAQVSP